VDRDRRFRGKSGGMFVDGGVEMQSQDSPATKRRASQALLKESERGTPHFESKEGEQGKSRRENLEG